MSTARCLSCLHEYEGALCPRCGYPADPKNAPHHLPVGTILRGRYQLGKVLGQGGFGITYLAWDTLMQTRVAVKEFFPTGTVYRINTESLRVECVTQDVIPHYNYSRERFLREANALVKFKDIPEIVDILDFVEENNTGYIVMEFVRGVDLARYIQGKGGRLSVEETFRILKPVMKALARVHEGGIVHRDISPDNIILEPLGGAKLLDFGAVRSVENPDVEKGLAKSTEAILKHGFAPLEQYNTRGSLGPWTDEYAMCATVWYCLTGQIPEEASIRVSEGIDPDWSSIPGLPEHQQKALQKGFSCRAKDRYPSLYDLMADLFPGEFAKRNSVQTGAVETSIPEASPQFQKTVSIPSARGAQAAPPAKKKKSKAPLFLGIAAVAVIAAVVLFITVLQPKTSYDAAVALRAEGKYDEALAAFEALGDYRDSAQQISLTHYAHAQRLLGEQRYTEAIALFEKSQWEGYEEGICACHYEIAKQLKNEQKYDEAASIYASLGNYMDSATEELDCYFCKAVELGSMGQYQEAIAILEPLGNYRDSNELILNYRYFDGQERIAAGDDWGAIRVFTELGDYLDAPEVAATIRSRLAHKDVIAGGLWTSAAITNAGTVMTSGYVYPPGNTVSEWNHIVSVACGMNHIIGLREDGTVAAAGRTNESVFSDVQQWRDIIAIDANFGCYAGLRKDGTVVAAGVFTDNYGNEFDVDVSQWTGLVDVQAGGGHIVGLRYDGTVVAAGTNADGQCNVEDWTDIVAIEAGSFFTLGLRSDGTVVATGNNRDGQCNVEGWTDIIDLAGGYWHTAGLRTDGTVVTTSTDGYGLQLVSSWTDITAISAGGWHILGLRGTDGKLLAVGDNAEGQLNVSAFRNIRIP